MEYLKARIYIYISLVCLTLLGFVDHPAYQGDCNMAIEFDGASGLVNFPAATPINNLAQKTIIAVVNPDTFGENNFGRILDKRDWQFYAADSAPRTQAIEFLQAFDDATLIWYSASTITTGQINHMAVTYDRTSPSNDPVLYVDGSSVAVTQIGSSTGTAEDDSGEQMTAGNRDNAAGTDDRTFDGIIYKILIYNRILSASEIADDFNSRLFIPNYNGLVFACGFHGTKGLQVYEGASIAAGNLFVEHINGANGTPANTPTGRGDDYLTIEALSWQEGRGGS
jgi:hypothetical protein